MYKPLYKRLFYIRIAFLELLCIDFSIACLIKIYGIKLFTPDSQFKSYVYPLTCTTWRLAHINSKGFELFPLDCFHSKQLIYRLFCDQ